MEWDELHDTHKKVHILQVAERSIKAGIGLLFLSKDGHPEIVAHTEATLEKQLKFVREWIQEVHMERTRKLKLDHMSRREEID